MNAVSDSLVTTPRPGRHAARLSTGRRRSIRLLALVLLSGVASLAVSAAAQPPEAELEGLDAEAREAYMKQSSLPPDWKWRQEMGILRLGGRMSAVTVDPENPDNIYIGTEESTVVFSKDGGVTWREVEMDPIVIEDRYLTLTPPGLPKLGQKAETPFKLWFDPAYTNYIDRPRLTWNTGGTVYGSRSRFPSQRVGLGWSSGAIRGNPHTAQAAWDGINRNTSAFSRSGAGNRRVGWMPRGLKPLVVPVKGGVPQNLLVNATRTRKKEIRPVRRIAVCPGATYPILVATKLDLFGSQDGGRTYVRLFGLPGNLFLDYIECSRWNPNDVVLATHFGLYRSKDGGLTWDQVLVGWPGAPATAVTYGPPEEGHDTFIVAAWGAVVFVGDPDLEGDLRMVYPDFNNSDTAPWKDVRWIRVSDKGTIWMATDDGIRVSRDRGKSWKAEARDLFERQKIRQIEIGTNDEGGERVAVVQKRFVYATDDDGKTWHPYFLGLTNRMFRELAALRPDQTDDAKWWLATSGDLWSTTPPPRRDISRIDAEAAKWARRRLRLSPPMRVVVDGVLDGARLSPNEIAKALDQLRARNWLPGLQLNFVHQQRLWDLGSDRDVSRPFAYLETRSHSIWQIWLQATWYLKDAIVTTEDLNRGKIRERLHVLRRHLAYLAEDAYHERGVLLRKMASGEIDRIQAQILQARIESLEAVLEFWMRRPLIELASSRMN